MLPVANHFYKSISGDFVVLEIDPAKLSSGVKFEPAAPVGATESFTKTGSEAEPFFPHLYGTIDYDGVVRELLVKRDSDGTFQEISFAS